MWYRVLLLVALLLFGGLSTPCDSQDKILQKAIDQAIVRGTAYLKSFQRADGTWPHQEIGATSLAGLTLLECGVSKQDPAVQKAARAVRQATPEATHTYSVSLNIMFLDRLGDPLDVPLIEVLAARLMKAGANGAWSYGVEPFASERLSEYVKQCQDGQAKPSSKARQLGELPKDIQDLVAQIPEPEKDFHRMQIGDNSNTQFAVLALWIARRYGLPIEKVLAVTDKGYRLTQFWNGGWDYTAYCMEPEDKANYVQLPAMMCTGLIGMAAYYGARQDTAKKHLRDDPAVQKAFNGINRFIGLPTGIKRRPTLPTEGNSYYYLWTLERTAMLYDLKTIGGKDWYVWGSEILVAHQQNDGSWAGDYTQGGADTCFALLFLKRSNIAPDLTRILVQGIAKDSATSTSPSAKTVTNPAPAAKTDPGNTQARAEAVRLSTALLEATGSDRDAILDKIRQGKGLPFTQALAATIPQLKEDAQVKARKALVDRLAGLTVAELRGELKSLDIEIRRAAAGACASLKTKQSVPDLIDALADSEAAVIQSAHQALKEITAQDFGPAVGASREEREQAIRAWKEWWKRQ